MHCRVGWKLLAVIKDWYWKLCENVGGLTLLQYTMFISIPGNIRPNLVALDLLISVRDHDRLFQSRPSLLPSEFWNTYYVNVQHFALFRISLVLTQWRNTGKLLYTIFYVFLTARKLADAVLQVANLLLFLDVCLILLCLDHNGIIWSLYKLKDNWTIPTSCKIVVVLGLLLCLDHNGMILNFVRNVEFLSY